MKYHPANYNSQMRYRNKHKEKHNLTTLLSYYKRKVKEINKKLRELT